MAENNHPSQSASRQSTSSLIKEANLEEAAMQFDLRKILKGVFSHIPMILAITLICTIIGAYISYKLLHTYYAEATLIYPETHAGSVEAQYQILHLNMASASEMITLPVNVRAVKSILGLNESIEELTKMITVEPPTRGSNLIGIKVTSKNPNLSLEVANTLASVVVKSAQDLTQKQWQEAYTYFKNQETNLHQSIADQNKRMDKFREENGLVGGDNAILANLQDLKSAEQRLQNADLQYSQSLVQYENLKREFGKVPEQIEKPSIEHSVLQARLSQTEEALLEARAKYAPENPKVKALESQIDALQKMSTNEKTKGETGPKLYEANPVKEKLNLDLVNMQAKLRADQKYRDEMSDIVNQLKEKASKYSSLQAPYQELMDQRRHFEFQLRNNLEAQRSIEFILSLGKGDIEIYQLADKVFSYDTYTWVYFLPLVGFLLGALAGLGTAFFIEITDKKVRTAKQLELYYNVPCLGIIPEQEQTEKTSQQKMITYIRALAERLHLRISSPFASLAVCSSIKGEGKSFLAHQLALYYAGKQKKVLLLELDYRNNPFVREEEYPSARLESYLQGKATIDEIIAKGSLDHIRVGRDPEMKEHIKSDAMKKLWDVLRHSYDVIIVDVPGILEDEYAINAVTLTEECLFVVGSSIVDKKQVDASFGHLEIYGVSPIGIVLNRVQPLHLDNHFSREERTGASWKEFFLRFPEPRSKKIGSVQKDENFSYKNARER